MTNTLEYDHIRRPAPLVWLYWVALACVLLPMAAGTVIFLGYLVTGDEGFAFMGLFTIFAGLAATFIAVVCLAVYFYQARRANESDARVAMRNFRRAAIPLALNFPLAAVYAGVGMYLLDRASEMTDVIVTNGDATPILVTLETGGDTENLGPIQPGQTSKTRIEFGNAGLTATLTPGGGKPSTRQTVFDSFDEDTNGFGQPLRLQINDGKIEQR